jgi:hypothetical protein
MPTRPTQRSTPPGPSFGEEVLRLDFAPRMFTFRGPDDNLLISIEDRQEEDASR